MNEEKRLRTEHDRAARRAYWRYVIARGLKSLKEGRVTTWDETADRRLRAALEEDERHRADAWADAQAIANGELTSGGWDRIEAATERARRALEREANRWSWRRDLARALAALRVVRFRPWSNVKKLLREWYGRKLRGRNRPG